jgi:DDE superfamily endonuclease
VERPINRSKKVKVQNKHYSGKKKRHTRKNLVMTDNKKKILIISPTKHGRVHDKKMSDKFAFVTNLPESVTAIVDTGFVGIQKQHANTFIPKKKSKSNPVIEYDRQFNKLISSCRIPVEHAIGGMKNWKIFSEIMRNKKGIDDYFNFIIAGLHNFKLEMRSI